MLRPVGGKGEHHCYDPRGPRGGRVGSPNETTRVFVKRGAPMLQPVTVMEQVVAHQDLARVIHRVAGVPCPSSSRVPAA